MHCICTLTHCIANSEDCVTSYHPLYLFPHTCCLFVYLSSFLGITCCLPCLFISPFRLFLLIDGQWANVKSNCTHCIRRGLGRRLRSSLLLNSSPRCDLPCKIPYLTF